jgi:hypothetical protein
VVSGAVARGAMPRDAMPVEMFESVVSGAVAMGAMAGGAMAGRGAKAMGAKARRRRVAIICLKGAPRRAGQRWSTGAVRRHSEVATRAPQRAAGSKPLADGVHGQVNAGGPPPGLTVGNERASAPLARAVPPL